MLTIEITGGRAGRRICVPDPSTLTVDALRANVAHALSLTASFGLKYIDEEGDSVTLENDEDLAAAVRVAEGAQHGVLRLVVIDSSGAVLRGEPAATGQSATDVRPTVDATVPSEGPSGDPDDIVAHCHNWEPSLLEFIANEAYYGSLVLHAAVTDAVQKVRESEMATELVGAVRERVRRVSESARDHISALGEAIADIAGDEGWRDAAPTEPQRSEGGATAAAAAEGAQTSAPVETAEQPVSRWPRALEALVEMGFDRGVCVALLDAHDGDLRAALDELAA